MTVSLIAAMAQNRIIGDGMDIPWHIPEEQKLFRSITLGHAVIMGRLTYESIGKALDGRLNIVVTRQTSYQAPKCQTASNLKNAIAMGKSYSKEVFIIGGQGLFTEAMPFANRIYLTTVAKQVDGNRFFPEFDHSKFIILETRKIHGNIPWVFIIYERMTS